MASDPLYNTGTFGKRAPGPGIKANSGAEASVLITAPFLSRDISLSASPNKLNSKVHASLSLDFCD